MITKFWGLTLFEKPKDSFFGKQRERERERERERRERERERERES